MATSAEESECEDNTLWRGAKQKVTFEAAFVALNSWPKQKRNNVGIFSNFKLDNNHIYWNTCYS